MQVDDFLQYQYDCAARGVRYSQGPGRCDPDTSHYTDCSGLQTAALHHVGITTPEACMNSSQQWAWCVGAGTVTTVAHARVTKGCWLFVGLNGNEHIAVSTGGDPRGGQFAAHSPAHGLGFAPFDANEWFGAAWPPGLAHSDPPVPHPPLEEIVYDKIVPDAPLTADDLSDETQEFVGKRPAVVVLHGSPIAMHIHADDVAKYGGLGAFGVVPHDFFKSLDIRTK